MMLVLGFSLYVGSYLALSRQAYERSKQWGIEGFWFVLPVTTESKQHNKRLNFVYFPAIQIDLMLGTGRIPLCDPMTLE